MYKNLIIFLIGFLSREIHIIMYIRIVLGFVPTFFTSKYSFSSGVGYVMRPILLITWTTFQSFILLLLLLLLLIIIMMMVYQQHFHKKNGCTSANKM